MKEIFERVSVRRFEEKMVEDEKIRRVLEAAMCAPTAGNQRAWEFYVVTDRETLEELARTSNYSAPAGRAPVAIVVCYRTTKPEKGLDFPEMKEVDCALATQNMWLELEHLGLGGVMLGVAPVKERMEHVRKALNLPETLEPFTILPFGYPAKRHPLAEGRYEEDRVHYVTGK